MSLTRLWRILTIFALLVAPLGMLSGHAAMAMPGPAATAMEHEAMTSSGGHCADQDRQSGQQRGSSIDCMIACSALPSAAFQVADQTATHTPAPTPALASSLRGRHPESDPPPPRLS